MNLHSPAFSGGFRRQLRAERRTSPVLRRAMRRHRHWRARLRPVFGVALRVLLGFFPAVLLLKAHASHWADVTAPAIAAWWFMEVIVVGASVVRAQALSAPPALALLPFAPGDFAVLARRRVKALAWHSFPDALLTLTVLAWLHADSATAWLAVPPLAALCALSVWTGAVCLACRPLPGFVTTVLFLIPYGAIFALNNQVFVHWLRREMTGNAVLLSLLSPGGWVSAAYLGGLGVLPQTWLLALVPAALLAATAPRALALLAASIDPEEHLRPLYGGAPLPEQEEDEDDPRESAAVPEVCTNATKPAFEAAWKGSAATATRQGWMERLFLRWLDTRERLVLECVASPMPAWTRLTWRSVQCLAFAVAVIWLRHWAPSAIAGALQVIGGLALVAGVSIGLPLASGFNRMMERVNTYGILVARPALYPLRLQEFVRLTWKSAAIRGVCMAPVLALTGAALAAGWRMPTTVFVAGGVKLAILSVFAAPWMCIMAVSAASNDTSARAWRGVCSAGQLVASCIILLGLVAGTVFAPPLAAMLCAAAFATLAWGAARLYVRTYDRGGFDLVQPVKR